MIRKNQLNCNLIRIKNSTKSIFDSCMESFKPEMETCPLCKRTGDCHIHAYYNRFIIDFISGAPVIDQIRIPRIICSCGHTHAILPDPIIPYDSYTLFFMLRVLAEYHLRLKTVNKICEVFMIPTTTLYRWIHLYNDHRREWQGLLSSVEQDVLDSLKNLIRKDPFSDFATFFFQKIGKSFMQSHKNPTHSPRIAAPP